ncbi:molecular chaperone Hsp31 and glyoxalase 3 [Actinomycetospora succinea]|uniref:Molecular chaperone Hsp31 and glyoxalase 3 n=1 Tax=Actinomycetospora succinea TaxID=663603 RepID=A0A4R6VEW8_9PSEU|nr:glyoxalase III HchA [Actinomycetospora succinea]TDQ61079.1 molecular chaperone Hsp31 and glyoxalase 3 [Actinomycetospora succinea]
MTPHDTADDSTEPTPDRAERDAFFPSPYSLGQYVPPRTDFTGVDQPDGYTGGRWKVLVIGVDERYLPMQNGRLFSTGNHPVETLLPMMHLHRTGFGIDVATVSGNPVKFEHWAMPADDDAVHKAYDTFAPRFRDPLKLADVVEQGLGPDSDYLAVFIPGGHGAMVGLAESDDVRAVLDRALALDRFVITLCHGPAALVAAGRHRDRSPFEGYRMCVFPDALDTGANLDIGYIPGPMPWLAAARLREEGVVVTNEDMAGHVLRDRRLLTGDSPLAANELGRLAASALLEDVRERDR